MPVSISPVLIGAKQLTAEGTVLVTFTAAAFGSFLAVAVQAWVSRRGSQGHFRALVSALRDEMGTIEREVEERSQRAPTDVRLDPPYPTMAWETLVSSPEVRRLGDAYGPLSRFYAAVDGANHRITQVATLLQISATASDDQLRLSYRDLAQQFSGPSHQDVVATLPGAAQAAERVGS